ncbi:unnamed protein product [Coccothraustes coccothraustes]
MKSVLYLCLLLLGLQVQAHQQVQQIPVPEDQPQADYENLPYVKLAPSNADFAFKLYKQISDELGDRNIFFSPLSISTAFAMLTLGARSNTLRELQKGLAFNLTQMEEQEIHEGFQHILQLLNDPHREEQLNMGNALFIDNQVELLQNFLDAVTNFYYAEPVYSNFQNLTQAMREINMYVETKTHGKIVDLVKSLDAETVMVLINYVFFRGDWEKPFKAEHTEEREFFVDAETTVKVPMMFQMGRFDFYFDEELSCTVVRLHYNGSATAFLVLPEKGEMKRLEQTLDKETIQKWSDHLFQRFMSLYFPKFSISGRYEISNTLKKMGIVDVFTNQADLSGITGTPDLKVSKVVHKASLDVDEKGTEAAAATAVEIMPLSSPPTIEFSHPFLMLIFDRDTNSTLFIGKIVNPTITSSSDI